MRRNFDLKLGSFSARSVWVNAVSKWAMLYIKRTVKCDTSGAIEYHFSGVIEYDS